EARIPLATSFPSMAIGLVYATTFASLGMTASAVGSLAAGGMWCLIALLRSPPRVADATSTRTEHARLFATDLWRWGGRTVTHRQVSDQYLPE
ncbi:MAG: hypothetical protein M8354_15020, partial [Halalkalicoccus sp.]|nr:hypothetical protein [Halalkalicoccus sp.]